MSSDVSKKWTKQLSRQNSTSQITRPKKASSCSGKDSGKTTTAVTHYDLPFSEKENVLLSTEDGTNGSAGEDEQQSMKLAIDGATSEFKLVKKVAELTQVVHMLFRSSHCLETELSLAKERSTQEVDRLINTYDSQVNELQNQIREKGERIKELERRLSGVGSEQEAQMRLREFDLDQTRRQVEQLTANCAKLTASLEDSREVNMNLAKELEESREQSAQKSYLMGDLQTQVEALTKHTHSLASQKRDLEARMKLTEEQADKEKGELLAKCAEKDTRLDEQSRIIGQLRERLGKLERWYKDNNNGEDPDSPPNGLTRRNTRTQDMDESLEVARLRRELKQARLELLNRESNFNRVFTQVQPVHVTSSSDQKYVQWLPNITTSSSSASPAASRVQSEQKQSSSASASSSIAVRGSQTRRGILLNTPMHSRVRKTGTNSNNNSHFPMPTQSSLSTSAEFRSLTRKSSSFL